MVKIYTRTGDKGTTGLADGSRLEKDHVRIESYGTVDELNSVIGICRCHLVDLSSPESMSSPRKRGSTLDSWLLAIQNDLFNLGSDLATPIASRWEKIILVDENDVKQLEKMIDFLQKELPPIAYFVLPGGTNLNSYFHLARTVCRRAERCVVSLQKEAEINLFAVVYLNRLSDLLFVMARYAQHFLHGQEIKWDSQMGVRFLGLDK